ncbi:unnamed protein product [Adineta ricciae]|uniref:Uncharacterized protein n=1 Tax=Adineta ricciae TaxID=249248 RepID=A0A816GWE9_ADIRI|nr:unnamed protein product [Adineta ricciae]
MTAETSHKWASMFLDSDHTEFIRDSRGGKHSDSFYDTYPEIEADAKAFVADKCSQKSGEFKAIDLARFINKQYCDLNDIDEQANDGYIRSERSSQLDLRRWGAKFEANAQRPYFEGHERDDVVKHRNDPGQQIRCWIRSDLTGSDHPTKSDRIPGNGIALESD